LARMRRRRREPRQGQGDRFLKGVLPMALASNVATLFGALVTSAPTVEIDSGNLYTVWCRGFLAFSLFF
jgi:hypothetical protein